jgi:hypothetical protein
VSDKFDGGVVDECYACSYTIDDQGNVSGRPNCGEMIDALNKNNIPSQKCPRYATKSCFEAGSTHDENNGQVNEDYRRVTFLKMFL